LRCLHEGAETGLDWVAKFAEAEGGDDAIFPFERDGVGDGGDGNELEEGGDETALEAEALGFGVFACVGCGEQEGVGEFEGDCCAAEGFEGVGAVSLSGVQDGNGFGNASCIVGEMVIGDDQIDSEGFCFGGSGEGADAGVYADDETDAGCGGLAEDTGLHAVAFAEAVGDVVGDDGGRIFGRGAFDGGFEKNGGGGAVDVVVAVDEDGFSGADCMLDAGYGHVHAEHKHGAVQIIDGGFEEGLSGSGLRDASREDECGDGVWAVKVLGQTRYGGGICRLKYP
jgi:hypothetical protein